jgi:ubiquinone/menaquinone biosynthesis C-methylase UbiE
VDDLDLPRGARALEVGCGAGLTAIELAKRGLRVEATDAVDAMVDLARREATAAQVADLVHVALADAHDLAFADESFDLVIAMGVMPWLESPSIALAEVARVLKPGGVLIVNCDNAARLTHLLDPVWNRHLAALRARIARVLPSSWIPPTVVRITQHSIPTFDEMVTRAGLEKEMGKSFGFGPFTLFGHPVVPQRFEVSLHRTLQRAADHGSVVFRTRGAQYIVRARKP